MIVLAVMLASAVVLLVAGRMYSDFIARRIGEDPGRPTPALAKNDGVDYVPTPTPVVFAHHFASIAGALPIIGPVIAIVYGWVPALLWVVLGGVFIGAVHDYLATYIATREGGTSIATIVRRLLGKDAFVAITIFLVIMLALVCATFLNLSAKALTSQLPFDRLELSAGQTLFRTTADGSEVIIGGIASMSVVCITAVAPLVGYLYLKRKVAVWKCSLLAIGICAASITVGLFRPIPISENTWKLLLSGYVLIAAGVPVWIFLQSRDFINVHILYVGMGGLLVTLLVGGARGASVEGNIPAFNVAQGTEALGGIWPGLFIVIACGAVSGFHSLCAGGTTAKQVTSEPAARRVSYYGMLLESFLAVCVIAVLMIGASRVNYLQDVHPILIGGAGKGNAVLGFAMAVGNAARIAWGVPIAVGALAGMILLEGFLVTTLDTAIRLTRYLIEEVWRTFFGNFDVFADPVAARDGQKWQDGEPIPIGAGGIPAEPDSAASAPGPAAAIATRGPLRWLLKLMRQYWFNSALAVAIMLTFALTGGQLALLKVFATSNQLLAAMVLSLVALWLLRRGRSFWFAFLPAVAMLATTGTNLVLLGRAFIRQGEVVLLTADVIIMIITVYLLIAGIRAALRGPKAAAADS